MKHKGDDLNPAEVRLLVTPRVLLAAADEAELAGDDRLAAAIRSYTAATSIGPDVEIPLYTTPANAAKLNLYRLRAEMGRLTGDLWITHVTIVTCAAETIAGRSPFVPGFLGASGL